MKQANLSPSQVRDTSSWIRMMAVEGKGSARFSFHLKAEAIELLMA